MAGGSSEDVSGSPKEKDTEPPGETVNRMMTEPPPTSSLGSAPLGSGSHLGSTSHMQVSARNGTSSWHRGQMAYTFRRGDSALRASHIQVLLGFFGAILSNNHGDEMTHNLSEPTDKIDCFVSHNWSTPRCLKFGALVLYFNFEAAMIATLASLGFMLLLGVFGALPQLHVTETVPDGTVNSWEIGLCATLVGPWIFLIVLLTWHELASRASLMRTRVFLDKTCINQTSAQKKKEGIMKLAAFLERSDAFVIIYSETYLRRLWTVFELASFLILFSDKNFKVIPVFFPKMLVVGLLVSQLFELLWVVVEKTDSGNDTKIIRFLFGSDVDLDIYILAPLLQNIFFVLISIAWGIMDTRIREAVESFRLSEAACFDEADRALVKDAVERFLKGMGNVQDNLPQEEALLAFEKIVHKEVPRKLLNALGPVGIPYRYMVAIFMPISCKLVDITGLHIKTSIRNGEDAWEVFEAVSGTAIFQMMVHFVSLPLLMGVSSLMVRKGLLLRRSLLQWQRVLLYVAMTVGLLAVTIGTVAFNTRMYRTVISEFEPDSAWDWVASRASFVLGGGLLTWGVFYWIPRLDLLRKPQSNFNRKISSSSMFTDSVASCTDTPCNTKRLDEILQSRDSSRF